MTEHKHIADQLITLAKADNELRKKLMQSGELVDGYNEQMAELHNRNAAELNKIIAQIGYPTIEKVGKQANEAAWLVIQHSIGQPVFMKKCLKLLQQAVEEEQTNPIHLAYLSDRIASFEDRPQLYGTQFDWDKNGQLSPKPFDELLQVNQRRKELGLNTLEEQTEKMRARTRAENEQPPTDLAKRKQDYDAWRRTVGWIK